MVTHHFAGVATAWRRARYGRAFRRRIDSYRRRRAAGERYHHMGPLRSSIALGWRRLPNDPNRWDSHARKIARFRVKTAANTIKRFVKRSLTRHKTKKQRLIRHYIKHGQLPVK